MKRALVVALLATPALAAAQPVPSVGVISFAEDNLVGAPECDPARTLQATWLIGNQGQPVTVTGLGEYRVFASNEEPLTLAGNLRRCLTTSNETTGVIAGQISVDVAGPTANPQTVQLPIRQMIDAAGRTCDTVGEQTFHVCVEYIEGGTAVGSAVGSLTLDTRVPLEPVSAKADSADGALIVHWESAEGGVNATQFIVTAGRCAAPTLGECPPEAFQEERRGEALASGFRLDPLENNVQYEVRVSAESEAGTPSATFARALGTPLPVDDFWEIYGRAGGREEGGCATSQGGALAILAACALLLRFRRRS